MEYISSMASKIWLNLSSDFVIYHIQNVAKSELRFCQNTEKSELRFCQICASFLYQCTGIGSRATYHGCKEPVPMLSTVIFKNRFIDLKCVTEPGNGSRNGVMSLFSSFEKGCSHIGLPRPFHTE